MPRISLALLLSLSLPNLLVFADVPVFDEFKIRENPRDLLSEEAIRHLAELKIKQSVEKIIARKNIRPDDLPNPEEFPTGSVELKSNRDRLFVGESLDTKVTWSTNVPKNVDGQFTYHMHIAHFTGDRYRGSRRTWGIAMARYNGNEYATITASQVKEPGTHRMLGILCAWSIKTEEVHVLDVDEAVYSVAAR